MKTLIIMQESHGFHAEVSYNISTAAVSAYVKHMGHNTVCLNLNKIRQSFNHSSTEGIYDSFKPYQTEAVYEFVNTHDPDVVMVGGLATDWEQIKQVCDKARMAKSTVIIVIGGGLVTYSPEEAMRMIDSADFGVIGEGEVTAHELLVALEHSNTVKNIPGLIYRDDDRGFVITQDRDVIRDLDSLPFLDYEGFNLFDEIRTTKSMAISSSRSCPYGCTYCTHSGGGKYRQMSLDRIFGEIDYVIRHVPEVKTLSLCDELFATEKKRFEQFIERIAPYNLTWFLPMRADSLKDPYTFKKAVNAGCDEMQVGLESGSDTILKSMKKGITKAMLREFYKNANESNISISSMVIFGDTEETMETAEESLAFANEISHINPRVYIGAAAIRLYPGSPLYDDAIKKKRIVDTTKFIINKFPLVNVSKMSDEEYNFLVKRIIPIMRIFHYLRAVVGRQNAWDYYRRANGTSDINRYAFMKCTDINLGEKSFLLSYVCPYCNKEQQIVVKKMTYGIGFDDVSYCSNCKANRQEKNEIHKALLLDDGYFQLVKPILKELLLERGNVGIVGIGSFFARYRLEFKKVFNELEMSTNNQFILSDNDPEIADKTVAIGRMVYNMESTLDHVKSIVVPSVYYPQIKELVKSKNSKMNVYDFFELPWIT